MSDSNNPFSIGDHEVLKETDKAILVTDGDDDDGKWVPKSCIHDNSEVVGIEINNTIYLTL